jgi:hypothetical protein
MWVAWLAAAWGSPATRAVLAPGWRGEEGLRHSLVLFRLQQLGKTEAAVVVALVVAVVAVAQAVAPLLPQVTASGLQGGAVVWRWCGYKAAGTFGPWQLWPLPPTWQL